MLGNQECCYPYGHAKCVKCFSLFNSVEQWFIGVCTTSNILVWSSWDPHFESLCPVLKAVFGISSSTISIWYKILLLRDSKNVNEMDYWCFSSIFNLSFHFPTVEFSMSIGSEINRDVNGCSNKMFGFTCKWYKVTVNFMIACYSAMFMWWLRIYIYIIRYIEYIFLDG